MNLKEINVDLKAIYDGLIESIDDYIYIGDLTTNTFFVSSNMVSDFELPGQILKDLVPVWGELVHEQDKIRFYRSIQDMLDGKTDYHNEEYQIRNRQGHYIWVHCRGKIGRDPKTLEPISFVGVVKNQENMGRIDQVTGLYIHDKFREQISQLQESSKLTEGGVLMLGIDNFTSINTLNSHHFGDLVLRNTAQIIQGLLPKGSHLYRFDGDQFALLAPNSNRRELNDLYRNIQTHTSKRQFIGENSYEFTVSAGAVCFSESGYTWENIETCAYISLTAAKKNGKNQCIFFSPEMLDFKIREQKILQLMTDSIRNNFQGFSLNLQPIVEVKTLKILGAEALLRYECECYGKLSPVEFVPLLENTGLIIQVGEWIMIQAMQLCKKWIPYIPDFVMNINVSYLQFRNKDFCTFVESALYRCEIASRHITLEMTESYFVTDEGQIAKSLEFLRSLGLKIAMDDFGTGYSSLGRLTQFHVDNIKIDRLFVQSLHANDYNREFIASVIRLCHRAGMSVCIEGIETKDELEEISKLNSDTLQGFVVSKPVSEEVFFDKFVKHPYFNLWNES